MKNKCPLPKDFKITIGDYTITNSDWHKGSLWLENAIGEGWEISHMELMGLFEKSLDDLWKHF